MFLYENDMFKRQIKLDHYNPRPVPIICHVPDTPWFSLFTTLKRLSYEIDFENVDEN
jgi:hypothetical protein